MGAWYQGYVQKVGLFASLAHEERATWDEHFTCFWVHPDDAVRGRDGREAWDGIHHFYLMNWLVLNP